MLSLYTKMNLPACFMQAFVGLNFVDFDKKPLFMRKSTFHGYFVVPVA